MERIARTPPSLVTLILLTGISTLSLNMFVPSLANIALSFKADYAVVSLSIGGYLAVTAVLQLVIGPLSDRFGRRPVILISVGLFLAASVGCLIARDVWVFLLFRIVQGAIIAGAALSPAIVRDTHAPEATASILGYIAMAMAVAPMSGPVLGGVLDYAFGWRSSFGVFAALGAALLALCWFDLGETNPNRMRQISKPARGYSKLLINHRFWAFALCSAFSTSAFYAFLAGVPIIAALVFDIGAGQLGLYIGSITCGFFLGSWVAGSVGGRISLGATMIAGRVVAVSGLCMGILIGLLGQVDPLFFFGATIFVGIGNGITMPASSAGAMSAHPDLAGSASGLAGALTVGGGAVITTMTGLLLSDGPDPLHLLLIMLVTTGLALLAAIWIVLDDWNDGQPR